MDSIEALRIAALQMRTESRGAGSDTHTLMVLASDVDRAREQLESARRELGSVRYEMERLKSQLQMETEGRGREKLRADKAEARAGDWCGRAGDFLLQLGTAKGLIRKLRKELRAAKGGG